MAGDPHQPASAPRAEARRRASASSSRWRCSLGDRWRSASSALVHGMLAAQIENQNSRNTLLKAEIAKLDEQIKEIDRLREQISARARRASRSSRRCRPIAPRRCTCSTSSCASCPTASTCKSVRQTGAKVTRHRLRAVQRARLDADAQHRGLALARPARAGGDQAGPGAQRSAPRPRPRRSTSSCSTSQVKRVAPPDPALAPTPLPPRRARRPRPPRRRRGQGRSCRRSRGRHEPRRPPPPQPARRRQLADAARRSCMLLALVPGDRRARAASSTGRTSGRPLEKPPRPRRASCKERVRARRRPRRSTSSCTCSS